MTLQSAIEAELPFLRAEAEALMYDSFEFRDYGDGFHYDPEAGVDVRDYAVLFTSVGKIMTNTVPSNAEVGGRTAVGIDQTLHIPASSPVVAVGVVAHRVSDDVEFTVRADVTHPQPKSRRLSVERVLS